MSRGRLRSGRRAVDGTRGASLVRSTVSDRKLAKPNAVFYWKRRMLAEVSWRRACVQLAEFEALRDVLEEQMSKPHEARQTSAA